MRIMYNKIHMKKESSFNRIVIPGETDETKATMLELLSDGFTQSTKEFLPGEALKTEKETEMCIEGCRYINSVSEIYGGATLDIDPDQIHIFDYLVKNGVRRTGVYTAQEQQIQVERAKTEIGTADRIIHEMVHKISYGAIQVTTTGRTGSLYRLGISGTNRAETEQYFLGLNEALTEELVIHIIDSFKKDGLLQGNKDLELISRNNIDPHDVLETYPDGSLNIYVYQEERDKLKNLIQEIVKKHPGSNSKEVLDVFYTAFFSGNMILLAKLIKNTFGKGVHIKDIGRAYN